MRSKPYSIRFDAEKLKLVQDKENLDSVQKAADYLFEAYWWQNKLGKPEVKQEVVQPKKEAPELPKPSPQQAYMDGLKDAKSVAEIQKIVSVCKKDSELAGWQKTAIEKYGVEMSRLID